MKNKILDKLHGFDCAPKDRFALLTFKVMTMSEFVIYEFCIAIRDWDTRHENYGCINSTNNQIASYLGFNTSTVTRIKNKLIEKGWLTKQSNGMIKIKDYSKWTTEYWKNIKDSGAKKHKAYADVHNAYANYHKDSFEKVSYKENVSVGISAMETINTAQDFERLVPDIFKK